MKTKEVIRAAAALSLVLFTTAVCMELAKNFRGAKPPRGLPGPVLAIEMAKTMEEVRAIAGAPGGPDSTQMESQVRMDFLFIPAYTAEFLLCALLLSRRTTFRGRSFRGAARIMGWTAAALSVLGAVFDLRENAGILRALRVMGGADDALARAISNAATIKWACLFAAMGLLSFVFIGRHDRGREKLVFALPGVFFLLAAVAGLFGLFVVWLMPEKGAALSFFSLPMGLGVLSLVAALHWSTAKFEEGL